MKKLYTGIFVLLSVITAKAQLSDGGEPLSFKQPQLKSSATNSYNLKKLNIEKHKAEDEEKGIKNRYAIVAQKNIDIKKKGSKTTLDDGSIYIYRITSENAYSLGLTFSNFNIPEGAKLYLYNDDHSVIFGAYTSKNNKPHKRFTIGDFPGNTVTIEYFEPKDAAFEGTIVLGSISQAYKETFRPTGLKSGNSADNINITCEEGNKHQLEKHAVARISFTVGGDGYVCTGALINNANNDGTPYFLTANHCISDASPASTVVAYFNYEGANCSSSTSSINQSLSGSSLIATWQDTDMTLLLLDNTPPASYQPYYAGWNAEDDDTITFVAGIHHPGGDIKKIALDYDEIVSDPLENYWEGGVSSPPHSHWLVQFDKGWTEGGSSGSPIFDSTKKIVGQLHGGSAGIDLYGKISRSWNGGAQNSNQLKHWLDPNDSGTLKLDGYAPSGNNIEAYFYADFTKVCKGSGITLRNASNFNPDSYTWSISPSKYTFLDGTNASSVNPVVSFDSANAKYSIILEATKGIDTDSKTATNYIETGDLLVDIFHTLDTAIDASTFTSLKLFGEGASAYSWNVVDTSNIILIEDSTQLSKDELHLITVENANLALEPTFKVVLEGSHGTCTSTDSVEFVFRSQPNDNVQNATLITIGWNGPFSNKGATIQQYEPYPAGTNCNTQYTWCSCNVKDEILDNSVWFKFVAPESGIITINAPGFDNQIALWDADKAEDLISGNPALYALVAANDDYFGESQDYSALIDGASVTPGRTYWLQVDGSACGTWGEFNIELLTYPSSIDDITEHQSKSELFSVYPNPVKKELYIENNLLEGKIEISVISIDGRVIFEKQIQNTAPGEKIHLELPQSVPNGLYTLKVGNSTNHGIKSLCIIK